jgi:hypothetical protein
MPFRLPVAFAIFIAFLAPAIPSPAQDAASARAFLQFAYKHYENGGKGVDFSGPRASLYFHSSLLALIRGDEKANGPGYVGVLDGDPVCGCQDWDGIRRLYPMTQGVVDQASAGQAGSTSTPTKYVYFFGGGKADGNGRMKDVLGGKGAGLAEMTNAGLPVPPGFTIQTEACREYMRGAAQPEIDIEMHAALERLESCRARSWARAKIPCWSRSAPAPSSPCPA